MISSKLASQSTDADRERLAQLTTCLELYCDDTDITPRELFERFSVMEITDGFRRHQGNDFIVAFAPISGLETSHIWKLLMRTRMYLEAKGTLPGRTQSASPKYWIQCNYRNKNLFPEGDHKCGYWMRSDAEYCLSCGHQLSGEKVYWTEAVPHIAGAVMGVIALLVISMHVPSPMSFRWIGTIVGSSVFLALAIFMGIAQKLEKKQKAVESAKRPPETLMGAQLNLRNKRNKLLQGIEKARGLLTAEEVSADEIELLKKANERRKRQLARVESEIKKITFLRWQNQVERMMEAVHEDFDPANPEYQPANRAESHLKRLEDEGEKLKDTWTETEPFGKEAHERITTLVSTCEVGRKMVKRREVLAALQDASVDDGETQSSVLADVELRGEATEAIKLKGEIAAPDFLQTEIALEGMRLAALSELEEKDERATALQKR